MTTAATASRLIELCTKGKFIEAQKELYHVDILSTEVDGSQFSGLTNMLAKEQKFLDSLETIHRIEFSDPLIAGSYFSVVLKMDIEIKTIGHKSFGEICVYKVVDGKIVSEQFFRG